MKNIIRSIVVLATCGLLASIGLAQVMPVSQVSPVRLKVSKKQKTDTSETFRSTDGRYRSNQKTKAISYTIDLTNISGGGAKEFVVKWSVAWQGNGWWSMGTSGGTFGGTKPNIHQGEKTVTLDFGKSVSIDTDRIELSTSESVDPWTQRSEYGPKLLGYVVEVYVNDQLVASDIQPANLKTKLGQAGNDAGEQKRHQF